MSLAFAATIILSSPGRAGELKSSSPVPSLSTAQLMSENEGLRKLFTEPPSDSRQFQGKRIAILTTDGVEAIELQANRDYFKNRGAEVEIVAPHMPEYPAKFGVQYPLQRQTQILTVRFMENADWVKIDRFVEDAEKQDYDAIIIAGGTWNPDSLRIDPNALAFVKKMNDHGKVIAAICHGPLVLVNAGLLKGRSATATWNVQEDLKNAGAQVKDVAVVVDGNLITSRHPIDLPDFLAAIGEALSK